MSKRIYVSLMNLTWSLSPEAWRKLVVAKVSGADFDLDALGKRLSRKRSEWDEQCFMSRWCHQDWTDALEDLQKEQS
jgi:hypothetical protein